MNVETRSPGYTSGGRERERRPSRPNATKQPTATERTGATTPTDRPTREQLSRFLSSLSPRSPFKTKQCTNHTREKSARERHRTPRKRFGVRTPLTTNFCASVLFYFMRFFLLCLLVVCSGLFLPSGFLLLNLRNRPCFSIKAIPSRTLTTPYA